MCRIAAYLIVTVTKAHSLTEAKYTVKQNGKYIKRRGISSSFLPFIFLSDMLHFVRRDIFAYAKVIFRLLRPWRSGILFAHTAAAGNITRRNRISQHRNNTRYMRIELKKHLRMQVLFSGGGRWIRTIEVTDNRFTVCPLWPLGNSPWSW